MKTTLLSSLAIILTAITTSAQSTHFQPGHLAVLRAGDGVLSLKLKQSPAFIDEFDPAAPNSQPSLTVAIPTNGADSFFFNGHAATEGTLTLSPDHKLLTFGGYGGVDLLSEGGTASRLTDVKRGFATVDGSGKVQTYVYPNESSAKMNPRGAVTDGNGSFWGAGNASGTFYMNPASQKVPVRFDAMPNSRAVKIINNALYATMNGADAEAGDTTAGIYCFTPLALPTHADTSITLLIPVATNYQNIVTFDINPGGDTAYIADTEAGVQKYVKSGSAWKLAYNISIPQNIPASLNHATGCFGLTVDFSGAHPVIYATTTEGYNDSVNSNRVVRIVDTGANPTVTTVVQSPSTNIVYRGVAFTPN